MLRFMMITIAAAGLAGASLHGADAPSGLLCELLTAPEKTRVAVTNPHFGWIVPTTMPDDLQRAYQIIVTSNGQEAWDSGKVQSGDSINVRYAGGPLRPGMRYEWKARTWNRQDQATGWSPPQSFATADQLVEYATTRYPRELHRVSPQRIDGKGDGHWFIDFGRHAFGYLEVEIDSPDARAIDVHLGEKATDGRIDRKPGGTIRYAHARLSLKPGRHTYRVETPPDKRNTSGNAILLPAEIGVILPFRYVELENVPGEVDASTVRQVAVLYHFDDDASHFESSDRELNAIWDLCKYSIKATTSFGVYVDGDRERIPYEADAYINQLCHYGVDREFSLARHSHEYLLENPTWPTEWKQHSVLMAHADWMYTGDVRPIRQHYDVLKNEKTLTRHAREDGLLDTRDLRDIVDWPAGERDGYVMSPINTVVNAFHYRTLVQMAEMAAAIGRDDDSAEMSREAQRVKKAFNAQLFETSRGLYVDGEGVDHASLHANMFPLAFGLVPDDRKPSVIEFIKSRRMACSVYGAQYLLEALYENGAADYALSLITSDSDRGWLNMLRVGSTVTLEAWDIKYKPNLDWNHAWGAAPANIIPRYILGVRPLEPGFAKVLIAPQPAGLKQIKGTVPTIRGPVTVTLDANQLQVTIPANMTARIVLPWDAPNGVDVGSGRHAWRR
jgi:alpha-L-rhamnosidase